MNILNMNKTLFIDGVNLYQTHGQIFTARRLVGLFETDGGTRSMDMKGHQNEPTVQRRKMSAEILDSPSSRILPSDGSLFSYMLFWQRRI